MKHKVIRVITYESDSLANIKKQLEKSLRDHTYDLLTRITLKTIIIDSSAQDTLKAIVNDKTDFDGLVKE